MSEKTDYRPRIFLKEKPFNWSHVDADIKQVVSQFTSYLGTYPVLGASRYALLGPVGKLLAKIPSMPLAHKELMMKEIILAHEGGGERMMTTEARRLAEKAVDTLISIMNKPGVETRRGKVLEMINDEVFARRKLDELTFYEERNKYVLSKLTEKYGSLETVNKKFEKDLEKALKGRRTKRLSNDTFLTKSLGESLKGSKSPLGDDILTYVSEFSGKKGAVLVEEPESTEEGMEEETE
jgi:hypothetical protein